MGTAANAEGYPQSIVPPSGTTMNQANTQNDATPNGTASAEEGADLGNVVPQTGTPAGSGAGTQKCNLAAEDDSAEFDDCLLEAVWELILSTRGTSVRKIHQGQNNKFVKTQKEAC